VVRHVDLDSALEQALQGKLEAIDMDVVRCSFGVHLLKKSREARLSHEHGSMTSPLVLLEHDHHEFLLGHNFNYHQNSG
jgi:hypothetical protein